MPHWLRHISSLVFGPVSYPVRLNNNRLWSKTYDVLVLFPRLRLIDLQKRRWDGYQVLRQNLGHKTFSNMFHQSKSKFFNDRPLGIIFWTFIFSLRADFNLFWNSPRAPSSVFNFSTIVGFVCECLYDIQYIILETVWNIFYG